MRALITLVLFTFLGFASIAQVDLDDYYRNEGTSVKSLYRLNPEGNPYPERNPYKALNAKEDIRMNPYSVEISDNNTQPLMEAYISTWPEISSSLDEERGLSSRLNPYMASTMNAYDSPALEVNSVSDHVHILFRMSKKYLLPKVIEEVKKQSSKWLKEPDQGLRKFSWQAGYAAFSVSSSKVEVVKNYIKNQEEHHRTVTFQEEVEEFMKHYGVDEYDSRYFWSS